MENSRAAFQSEELVSSKLPEYCKSLQYTDAHGQVKELILPRNLDVDRPKRDRTVFNKSQLDYLEDEFSRRQYLDRRERSVLAEKLRLTEAQIKVWFQNRRTKLKKISIPNHTSPPSIISPFSLTYQPLTFDKQEVSVNKSLSNQQINEFWQPFKSDSSFKTNSTSSLKVSSNSLFRASSTSSFETNFTSSSLHHDSFFTRKIRNDDAPSSPSFYKSFEQFGRFHSTFAGQSSSTEVLKVETKVYQDVADEIQLPQRETSMLSQQKRFSFETPDADK